MARTIELRRHTHNDGDVLTSEGVVAAVAIGRGLRGGYALVASSGAQRATQTAACFIAGLGEPVPGGVVVEAGLRSMREDDWRTAYRQAGAGDLESLREADPDLVAEDSAVLAAGLRAVIERLDDGQTALCVGHSPTSEAATFGLTGVIVAPLGKGDGVRIVERDGAYTVEPLE